MRTSFLHTHIQKCTAFFIDEDKNRFGGFSGFDNKPHSNSNSNSNAAQSGNDPSTMFNFRAGNSTNLEEQPLHGVTQAMDIDMSSQNGDDEDDGPTLPKSSAADLIAKLGELGSEFSFFSDFSDFCFADVYVCV